MIQELKAVQTKNSLKEIQFLSDTIVTISNQIAKDTGELAESSSHAHNAISQQKVLEYFEDFRNIINNLTQIDSSLNKLTILEEQKNSLKEFQQKYFNFLENEYTKILKRIDNNINELENYLALISTLEFFNQARKLDLKNCIDWFNNLSISLNYLLEVLENNIDLEKYRHPLEIIEASIQAIISMNNLRYLYTTVEKSKQYEFKKCLSSTISTGKAILYELDKKLLKIKNFDEEYSVLQVKEGKEAFKSLDDFFDYVDKSYIESLKESDSDT